MASFAASELSGMVKVMYSIKHKPELKQSDVRKDFAWVSATLNPIT